LCWDNWDDFITGGEDGLNASVPPTIDLGVGGADIGSLADYLDIATGVQTTVSAIPFRAYALIYNEYFRDQDLQDPVPVSLADGLDTTTNTDLLRACWGKDYFTTCRPDTQKGDQVEIGLAGNAPITANATPLGNEKISIIDADGEESTLGANTSRVELYAKESGEQLFADLSSVSSIDLNDLRLASALQRYKENILRSGARPSERIKAAFGVQPSDQSLHRPEFLGMGKNVIQFSEIIQSAPSSDDTSAESVGTLKGHGMSVVRRGKYRKKIKEYGYIITVMTVRPKTKYQDGIPRHFKRSTKEEYFQPELQQIGMQQVKNHEIYAAHTNPDDPFGYQNRYSEYAHTFDKVSGELRDTLDYWHMGRQFGSEPALNSDFVECEGVDRPFSSAADEFVTRCFHDIKIKNRVVKQNARPTLF
jgi:hypothetical protein